jgi:hypothetical protein
MKKIFILIFLCLCLCVSLFFACRKKTDCSAYQITSTEESFLCYKQGQIAIFKNDITGLIDTLSVVSVGHEPRGQNYTSCNNTIVAVGAVIYWPIINKLPGGNINVEVYHNTTPYTDVGGSSFKLSGSFQTITINSTTYNDVYSVSIDSNSVNNTDPWKIDYSKSVGFVRFYMKKGVTWSKL